MNVRKLIVGNWKMNGLKESLKEVSALTNGLSNLKKTSTTLSDDLVIVICPPATLLASVTATVVDSGVASGGQDCHAKGSGAHTGDISAHMLADAGATYVIVGHSERRSDHGETSADIEAKAQAAIGAGLIPIICVGETEAQRDAGQAEAVVLAQVRASLPNGCSAGQICFAYEPVWAIGTGRTPCIDDVAVVHGAIRRALLAQFGDVEGQTIAILYGGSVNAKNAAELLAVSEVNGALVGGASLTAPAFLGIIETQL